MIKYHGDIIISGQEELEKLEFLFWHNYHSAHSNLEWKRGGIWRRFTIGLTASKATTNSFTCKGQRWSRVLRRGWSVGTGKEAKLLRNHSQLWVLPSHQCFSIPGFLSTPPRCLCFWIPGCFCFLTPPCCLCFSIPGCFCFSTLQCCGCLCTSTTSPWFFVGSQGLHIRPLQYSWNENTKAWLLNEIDEDEFFRIVTPARDASIGRRWRGRFDFLAKLDRGSPQTTLKKNIVIGFKFKGHHN